jgi:hypothetical protein
MAKILVQPGMRLPMKRIALLLVAAPSFLYLACHSAEVTRFNDTEYPPTTKVSVYSDPGKAPNKYIEIGYVEASGGMTVSKAALLEDMKQKAMEEGADALIKVEFYDSTHYNANSGSYDKPHAKAVMIKFQSTKPTRKAK